MALTTPSGRHLEEQLALLVFGDNRYDVSLSVQVLQRFYEIVE